MSYQITKVDLIPNGEIVKCNASQFDNGRVLPFEIYENKVAYNIPNDVRVELHCRKPDGNIVTLPSDTITDNIVTFITTTQLTACYGDNVCEIALYGADDYLIGSANFILEVEKSPTYGGINSTSEIHNLESQIRDIAEDVIPEILPDYLDNYYTKSEVDELIDNIFPTFTASGSIASFITALNKPLVSVMAAESATTITRCGINFFDIDNANVVNGYISANSFSDSNTKAKTVYIPIKPNTSYTISKNAGVRFAAAVSNVIPTNGAIFTTRQVNNTASQLTIISGATDYYLWAWVYLEDSDTGTLADMLASVQIETGSTASEYHVYNGQTVPVSEATTLVTQSGVNNVFADVGDVTVGYKYMPMSETQNTLNRLTLSAVRSDIIKEKFEIEDIERGDKDE